MNGTHFPEFDLSSKVALVTGAAGELDVLLPGAKGWKTVKAGEAFDVPAQSKFNLKVRNITDYCCSYLN